MLVLRPSRPDDLDFVTALERRAEHLESIGQWTDLEHLATMQSPKREHWIIELDAAPAGYLIAYDGRARDAGIYVKRILVAEKDRGTGTLALAKYFDRVFGELRAKFAWLIVYESNGRGLAVYRRLGFQRFDPVGEVARRLDEAAEPPGTGAFRMLLKARDWESGTA